MTKKTQVPVPGAPEPQTSTNDTAVGSIKPATAAVVGEPVAAQSDAPRQYFVRSVPIRHNGKVYDPGHAIEMTDAQAERLGSLITAAETPF